MKRVLQVLMLMSLGVGSALAESHEFPTARDLEIERLIRERISQDGAVSSGAKRVSVRAANGRVTLTGQVDTAFDKAAVEKIATVFAEAAVTDELLVDNHE